MSWEFKREERKFDELPEGKYRVVIESAEMAVSMRGNDMLVIKMAVSGSPLHLWNYITFMEDKPEITNWMLTQFIDSFGIADGDFNLAGYVGKMGGANVKHDEDGRARVSYFLSKRQQEQLPAWQGETPKFTPAPVVDDDDIPF